MNPLRFLFAVHCHQPVGNFGHVFERAFDECYEPLLAEFDRHPGFKLSLHFSGPLLEYMEVRRRSCRDLVKVLAGRGQVELLGGGFYEPILSVIPEEDRLGQLRMMSRWLEEHFGRKPRGIWLTERVWEPQLAGTLARAGIEYTLLDEEHFHYAGVKDIHTSYVTEDEGLPLRVFPIDKTAPLPHPFPDGRGDRRGVRRDPGAGRDGHPRRRRREVRSLAGNRGMGLREGLAREIPGPPGRDGGPDDDLLRVRGLRASRGQGLSPAGFLRGDDGMGPRAA